MMRHLPASRQKATAWKNGGGITKEIAIFPPDASLDDFHWRVSSALVDADGPFSAFPGVDRILVVLRGEMTLSSPNAPSTRLSPHAPPFAFPGDVPVNASVLSGPVLDLNIMTRRGQCTASVTKLNVHHSIELASRCMTLIFLAAGDADIHASGGSCAVGAHDAVQFDGEIEHIVRIQPSTPVELIIIKIDCAPDHWRSEKHRA